jgi:hypothetical protein
MWNFNGFFDFFGIAPSNAVWKIHSKLNTDEKDNGESKLKFNARDFIKFSSDFVNGKTCSPKCINEAGQSYFNSFNPVTFLSKNFSTFLF